MTGGAAHQIKTSDKLLARIRADGANLPPCTVLLRTNRNRRSGTGTWSWFAYCPHWGEPGHDGHENLHYGSHWPMAALLRADRLTRQVLSCGDICIDPGQPSAGPRPTDEEQT